MSSRMLYYICEASPLNRAAAALVSLQHYFFSFFSFFSLASPPAPFALSALDDSRAFSFSFSALAAACNKTIGDNTNSFAAKMTQKKTVWGRGIRNPARYQWRRNNGARATLAAGSMDAFAAFLAAFCSGVSEAVAKRVRLHYPHQRNFTYQ